jgi:hypothetical protein
VTAFVALELVAVGVNDVDDETEGVVDALLHSAPAHGDAVTRSGGRHGRRSVVAGEGRAEPGAGEALGEQDERGALGGGTGDEVLGNGDVVRRVAVDHGDGLGDGEGEAVGCHGSSEGGMAGSASTE